MGNLKSMEELFAGRYFDREVIILCGRWYVRFKLSYRGLVEMMGERGLDLAHTTILRCLAVGHNASIEARREMRRPTSRLVGSVGYFRERYGETVLPLALDKAAGRDIPSVTFVKHQMITSTNVDIDYPLDILFQRNEGVSLLFSRH